MEIRMAVININQRSSMKSYQYQEGWTYTDDCSLYQFTIVLSQASNGIRRETNIASRRERSRRRFNEIAEVRHQNSADFGIVCLF